MPRKPHPAAGNGFDLSWAKVNLSDSIDAMEMLAHVENEINAIKAFLDNPDVPENEQTEARLRMLEELEEELVEVLFQDQFDLL